MARCGDEVNVQEGMHEVADCDVLSQQTVDDVGHGTTAHDHAGIARAVYGAGVLQRMHL